MVKDPSSQSGARPKSRSAILARQIASGSLRASFGRKGKWLRAQVWLWPLLAIPVVIILNLWIGHVVSKSIQDSLESNLQGIQTTTLTALDFWSRTQVANATAFTMQPAIADAFAGLHDETSVSVSPARLLSAAEATELREHLDEPVTAMGYVGYELVNLNGDVLAATHDDLVGKNIRNLYGSMPWIEVILSGIPSLSPTLPSAAAIPDRQGNVRAGIPTMFASAPVVRENGTTIGALMLRIAPDLDFTRILSIASTGKTGETYMFNTQGLLLSNSRFDDELKQLGLIPDNKVSQSILTLVLRDPGVDLTAGKRIATRPSEWPLTLPVRSVAEGRDGTNITGYRNYRGVEVVGSWWRIPGSQVGVVTEVAKAEAYRPYYVLRATMRGLVVLLALGAIAIYLLMLLARREQRSASQAVNAAQKLGQYALIEKIGSGGMGSVYHAEHAMMRRPTAVKLLNPEITSTETIARFEREVRLTCQLNHPNTIAIYDFGRTPDGTFYYAMEYLDGLSLQKLVALYGRQPEGRVINILLQVCGSLEEAHRMGLVHRDIKPANIMVNKRGGICDFVKVLDFGLVKSMRPAAETALVTAPDVMPGTPAYMAPEQISSHPDIDWRCDIYALGAVAYFLLTGTPLFLAGSIMELFQKHLAGTPEPMSDRAGKTISSDLEAIVLRCLEKERTKRFESAQELAAALGCCKSCGTWTATDAEVWWAQFSQAVGGTMVHPVPEQLESESWLEAGKK